MNPSRLAPFALTAFLLFPSSLGAQASKPGAFACLPKADRPGAEKLLAKCSPRYSLAVTLAREGLVPVLEQARELLDQYASGRLDGIIQAREADGLGQNGPGGATIREAIRVLETTCAAAESGLKAIGPPAEGKALAALLRRKAAKNDIAALAAAERAVLACFPAASRPALAELGSRFKAGGASAYIAYISALCESWLIDHEPFERILRAEASSLNDAATIGNSLRGLISLLKAQRAFLRRPWHFAYPPSIFGTEEDQSRGQSVDAFLSLAEARSAGYPAFAFALDEGLGDWLSSCSAFLPLLPDAALRTLSSRAGKDYAAYDIPEERMALGGSDAADIQKALSRILLFESALASGTEEEAAESAYQAAHDPLACHILASSPRYARQAQTLLSYWKTRYAALAASAFPEKEVEAFAVLENGSMSAALLVRAGRNDGGSLLATREDIGERIKTSKAELDALGFLARPIQILSLRPLRVLPENLSAAFAWRSLLFGGAE